MGMCVGPALKRNPVGDPGLGDGLDPGPGLGRAWGRRLLHVWLVALAGVVLALSMASPAAAHAELTSTSPENGAHVAEPPAEIRMVFTEGINLLDDGIRLVDDTGATMRTPTPGIEGHTVVWPMPPGLSDGAYTVSWNVVSSDGHPVAGAFSFAVGTASVAPVLAATGQGPQLGPTAPWPVVTVRLAGYLAFALLAGVIAFVLCCSRGQRSSPVLERLIRLGIVGGLLATVAGLLVQGPYTALAPMSQMFDPDLWRQTIATPFGAVMIIRLSLYAAIAPMCWPLSDLTDRLGQWTLSAILVALALTIAAAGHGNATGSVVDLAEVALHALAAGIWVGGLMVLVALGGSLERVELRRFATLALTSVAALVVTGVLNSLRELSSPWQLVDTRYGVLLALKLALVIVTLAAAAVSRRRTRHDEVPLRSVRVESLLTIGVLAITAALSMTSPPPLSNGSTAAAAAARSPASQADGAVAGMPLGSLGQAELSVRPATTAGSSLRLVLTDEQGQLLRRVRRVELKVSNPGRRVAGIPVQVAGRSGVWRADYRFPLPGTWVATVTVEEPGEPAVVTSGEVVIGSR